MLLQPFRPAARFYWKIRNLPTEWMNQISYLNSIIPTY
ncbi:hypothetical protein SAMN06272785_4148 [Serratia sp. JKS000199]|nr:hypothetical protein SAMN06272785_4148 [Serratia sp. JKS000199]